MKRYKKIILISDILRNSVQNIYYTDRSCSWFYNLFSKQIFDATNINVEIELASNPQLFNRKIFYKLAGYDKVSETNYLEIAKGNIKKEAIEYFKECFKDYFIIFQEAGSLKLVADQLQIPYIDVIISGIRFMDDLKFAFRSNRNEIMNKLLSHSIHESDIYYAANKIKAFYAGREAYNNNLEENSLLLCGQTEVDLSLIKNNKIISFIDYKNEIENLFSKYNKIYYKRHPYSQKNTENEKFISSFNNIEFLDENYYKLLSCKEIIAVAALSSGTLREATYFNKRVHAISHHFINYYNSSNKEIKNDDFVIVNDDYYSPIFWSNILSPIFTTNKCKKFMYQNRTNLLRQSLNVYWGYELNNSNNITNKKIVPQPNIKIENLIIEKDIDNSESEITDKDISVVVQGPIDKLQTKKCLKSIRKLLPQAEIVLSTWLGSDIIDLDYDQLVLSDDPGFGDVSPVTNKKNNVNRQIISTKNGINKTSRKYILKIRTDTEISNLGFLKYYNKLIKTPLKREKAYKYFKNRVFIDSYFTRNPQFHNRNQYGLCFHPSDLWLFGLKEDLANLFDINLQSKYVVNINSQNFQYRVPEQHIWISFLEKNGLNLPMTSMYYNEINTRTLTFRTIINNFFVLNHVKCGIELPKTFNKHKGNIFKYVMDTKQYLEKYIELYDNDYIIPTYFKYTSIMEIFSIEKYFTKLKYSFSEILIPFNKLYKWLKGLFDIILCIIKILMKIVLNSYKILWWLK